MGDNSADSRQRTRRQAASTRRGNALALSLIVIAIVSALAVGLVELQAALDGRQTASADRRQALYVAEAGISEATLAVSQGRSGAIATAERPATFGGSSIYWVEAEELPGGRVLLTAHAASGTARFSVRAMVLPNVSPVGEYGFFGDERVEIGYGAVLDGYDSNEGSYTSQLDPSLGFPSTGQGVEIYSNGDIVIAEAPTSAPTSAPAGGDDDPCDVPTPLWDSISCGHADPSWNTGDYMIVADTLPNYLFADVPHEATMTQYLEVMHGVLTGALPVAEAELMLGRANFRVIPDIKAGEDLAIGLVPSEEVALFDPLPISLAEYIYLFQRKATGASLADIELAYAALANGGTPPPPSEPVAAASGTGEEGGTFIFGEAVPGPDSYVATTGAAYIEQSSAPLKEDLHMPGVVVPGNLRIEVGPRALTPGETLTVTAEDVWMDGVTVPAGATLVLRGPMTLGTATLDVALQGTVVFDDSLGPVRLYVTDRLDLQPGSLVSSPAPHEDAFGTHVFVGGREGSLPGQRVAIAASGEFHGVLYAPEDDVVLPSSLRFFGAAAGKRLFVQDHTVASYDRAFATESAGVPSLPKILSWQVVPIEEGTIRSLRFDPVATLRMQGIEPLASADAARETRFEATYLDHSGNLLTYTGEASSFDWGNVGRLTNLRWLSPTTGQPLRWTLPAGYDPEALIVAFRADERMRIYGTLPPVQPAGADAELAPLDVYAGALEPAAPLAAAGAKGAAGAPVASAKAAPAPSDALAAAVPVEPIIEGASVAGAEVTGEGGAAEPTTAFGVDEIAALSQSADVSGISSMEKLAIAVDVLLQKSRDVDGDGQASSFALSLNDTTLSLTVADVGDAAHASDLAALVKLFDLVPAGGATFSKNVGSLATLIQGVLDTSAAAESAGYGSVLSGLGGG